MYMYFIGAFVRGIHLVDMSAESSVHKRHVRM